jgi:outer membrane immunogenic protein
VSGGFTSAHIQDINYSNLAGVLVATLPAHSRSGWFIGTGYEYNLGWLPGLTWKTEYRWADYGSVVDFVDGPPAPVPPAPVLVFNSNSHLFVQTIRSELVWRFNLGGYGSAPVMSRY